MNLAVPALVQEVLGMCALGPLHCQSFMFRTTSINSGWAVQGISPPNRQLYSLNPSPSCDRETVFGSHRVSILVNLSDYL